MTNFKFAAFMVLAVLGWMLMGCGATAKASGDGMILNPTFTSGGNGPQRVTLLSQPSESDDSEMAPVPMKPGRRSLPDGGVRLGMEPRPLEGKVTHVRYVPLYRAEVDYYMAMVYNNTGNYLELGGDGVATCNRDSIVIPDERRSKWHVRIDRNNVEHYLLKPGARACLTIDSEDACPPNKDACGVHVSAMEYSYSAPVVRFMRERGRDFAVPTIGGTFEGIRFD